MSGINIGPVHKKDVIRASIMLEHRVEYAIILAFDVKVRARPFRPSAPPHPTPLMGCATLSDAASERVWLRVPAGGARGCG